MTEPAPASPDRETSQAPRVVDDPAHSRYEMRVGDTLAGLIDYRHQGDVLLLTHTEVFPDFQGQGLASVLVGTALADLAARGIGVTPICPYIVSYLRGRDVPGLRVVPDRGQGRARP